MQWLVRTPEICPPPTPPPHTRPSRPGHVRLASPAVLQAHPRCACCVRCAALQWEDEIRKTARDSEEITILDW